MSFCCGHFETSGAICLAARYAGGEEEEGFYLLRETGRKEYARNAAQAVYVSGKKKKVSELRKKERRAGVRQVKWQEERKRALAGR